MLFNIDKSFITLIRAVNNITKTQLRNYNASKYITQKKEGDSSQNLIFSLLPEAYE